MSKYRTPAQPEPSEREAPYTPTTDDVRLRYCTQADPNRWDFERVRDAERAEFDRWLAAHDAEVLATRPAPVVSAEAVERATTRLIESGEVPIPWDANPRDYVEDAIVGVLAALGITVADTPAAEPDDDTGWRSFARDFLAYQTGEPGSEDRMRARAGLPPAADDEGGQDR